MFIRKPLGRGHALHEPLRHPDHSKPRTRREFLAQGFIAGGATALVPPALAFLMANPRIANAVSDDMNALKTLCGISNGAGFVPFIVFDLAGGANLMGSEVMCGGPNGPANGDFLTVAGYGKLGLPGNMVPGASTPGSFVDTSCGLMFHSDSAILRGMKLRMSAATAGNINGSCIPAITQNDSGNNPINPLYHIAKVGAKGSLLTLAGSQASLSGGNSVAPPSVIDVTIAPTKISSGADLKALAPGGNGVPLFTGVSAQTDNVGWTEAIARISKMKIDAVNTQLGSGDAPAKQLVQCNYVKPVNTAAIFNGPSALDIMADPIITGGPSSIFSATDIANGDFAKTAAIMKLVVNGFGGAACIQMGGYDYHNGNRMDGEARNQRAGECIGAVLEYAARVGQPVMIQVLSDGSLSSSSMVDNSTGGRGKLSWQNDNQNVAGTFFLVFSPAGRPTPLGSDKQQLGYFNPDGNVAANSAPPANAPNLMPEIIALNYLALHGRQSMMPTIFPGTAFGGPLIDKYSAFAPIRPM